METPFSARPSRRAGQQIIGNGTGVVRVRDHRTGGGARPRRIFVADDELVVSGLITALANPHIEISRPRTKVTRDILFAAAEASPDLALVEIEWAKDLSLIRSLRRLALQVVVLTNVDDEMVLAEALEAGADGFIDKGDGMDRVITGIHTALAGHRVTPTWTRTRLIRQLEERRATQWGKQAPFRHLTPNEAIVLAELVEGHAAEEIAERLGKSLATVRTQIRAVLQKLDVHSQLAAVALARHANWQFERGGSQVAGF